MKRRIELLRILALIGLTLPLVFSCNSPAKSKDNAVVKAEDISPAKAKDYEVVYQRTFGVIEVTMCYVKEVDDSKLIEAGKAIVGNKKMAYVYFYDDKSAIKNINSSSTITDAMPGDGFKAQYSAEYGYKKNISTYAVAPASGPLKIVPLEEKAKKSIYRWYTYYVENYTDSKESDSAMQKVAEKLPYSSDGMTEVFFFNDKNNAPKLAEDGGWSANESQNSWNAKYGKYCVGYYSVGGGYSGEFLKGWK